MFRLIKVTEQTSSEHVKRIRLHVPAGVVSFFVLSYDVQRNGRLQDYEVQKRFVL